MPASLVIFASLALFGMAFGAALETTLKSAPHGAEAQNFFDSIPDNEKDYFVSYALALEIANEDDPTAMSEAIVSFDDYTIKVPDDLDIPPDVLAHFESMDIPPGFTSGLYHWVRTEYSMGEHEVAVLAVKSEYCFPDGHCVDLNDVGNTCCPF